MISEFERQALWKDACFQAKVAGIDPSDPTFIKNAREAPAGLSFYDQVTQAIVKTRKEHEVAEQRKYTEGHLTLEEALEEARNYHTVR